MTTRRNLLLATLLAPVLLAASPSTVEAARPYPISRVPGPQWPDQNVVDVDLFAGRVLVNRNGAAVVVDRTKGRTIAVKSTSVDDLSGDGRIVFSADDLGRVYQERVGSRTVTRLTKALPDATWAASEVDSDTTGRYLAVTGINANFGRVSVFLADTTNKTSVDAAAGLGDALTSAGNATISADGRFVAFQAVDGVGSAQIHAYDRDTRILERVTTTTTGGASTGIITWSQISGNGRYVVFLSNAGDLVAGTTAGTLRMYRRDLQTNTTMLVADSLDPFGSDPTISFDGRRIAYQSSAKVRVPGRGVQVDSNVFVWTAGSVIKVVTDVTGSLPNGGTRGAVLSADGRSVVFNSIATDLVGSGRSGVFVARLPAF